MPPRKRSAFKGTVVVPVKVRIEASSAAEWNAVLQRLCTDDQPHTEWFACGPDTDHRAKSIGIVNPRAWRRKHRR